MSLADQVMTAMKTAMKAKDTLALESLRAIKSAVLLAQTDKSSGGTLTAEDEVRLLQKLVKQRKESAEIYTSQGREDLAEAEKAQAAVISQFLPEQASPEEIARIVEEVIAETGANGIGDMGKVMGMVTKKLAGKADGKAIATTVKAKLSSDG